MPRDDEEGRSLPSYVPGSDLNTGLIRGYPSDEELGVTVTDALMWDEEVDATRLQVEVENAVVKLSGKVNTERERWHAEDIARGIPGVGDVLNFIEIEQGGE
jgi:osmotically-inducible protein OsmY